LPLDAAIGLRRDELERLNASLERQTGRSAMLRRAAPQCSPTDDGLRKASSAVSTPVPNGTGIAWTALDGNPLGVPSYRKVPGLSGLDGISCPAVRQCFVAASSSSGAAIVASQLCLAARSPLAPRTSGPLLQ
jgi:hypothetical protein